MECSVDYFQEFAGYIKRKLAQQAYGGLLLTSFCIFGFIDAKIVETCHPGYGTVEDSHGALGHDDIDIMQESVYSGYAKRHGLKVLTVSLSHGLIGALYGSISGHKNDVGTIILVISMLKRCNSNLKSQNKTANMCSIIPFMVMQSFHYLIVSLPT
jgi:hypothetical protein